MTLTLPAGMAINAPILPGFETVLTPPALALVAKLHRALEQWNRCRINFDSDFTCARHFPRVAQKRKASHVRRAFHAKLAHGFGCILAGCQHCLDRTSDD